MRQAYIPKGPQVVAPRHRGPPWRDDGVELDLHSAPAIDWTLVACCAGKYCDAPEARQASNGNRVSSIAWSRRSATTRSGHERALRNVNRFDDW